MALGRTTALQQGQASNCSNPVLQFVNVTNTKDFQGFSRDVNSLEFVILGPDGVAVFPTPGDPNDFQTIDVDNDCPVGGRIGFGRYVAEWTPAADAEVGEWTIRWQMVEEAGGPTLTYDQTFQLVSSKQPIPDAYVTIAEARAEGVPRGISDSQLKRALERASVYVEEVTGRKFYPHYVAAEVDGEGGPMLQLDEPVIAVETLDFTFTTFTPADLPIESGAIRIYNRHIRLNLFQPDDRDDPRIEFLRVDTTRFPNGFRVRYADLLSNALGFTQSQQNVKVVGLYGYTDPDGSPMGKTPDLIKLVTMRIAFMRYARPLWGQVSGGGQAGPILSEKTMDQSVRFADPTSGSNVRQGAFTGDPDTDEILANYCRPPAFRSA